MIENSINYQGKKEVFLEGKIGCVNKHGEVPNN